MALVIKDRVQEFTSTAGTGTLTLTGAVPGFSSFAGIGNGNTTYYCITDNTSLWEAGIGTYTASGTTLSRDTVLSNSAGTTALINFGAGVKNVFCGQPSQKAIYQDANGSAVGVFASGTLMLFQQTSAPTGWTKQTTHNDKALRVVSGAASSGGTSAFSTVFANQTPTITTSGLSISATTLSTAQLASHSHTTSTYLSSSVGGGTSPISNPCGYAFISGTNAAGSGNSHTHSLSGSATSSAITLNVQYVDLIIASKD